MKRIYFFLLLFILGCAERREFSEQEVMRILYAEKELNNFMQTNVTLAQQETILPENLLELQKQEGGIGDWYRKVPSGKYLQVIIQNQQGNQFIVLIETKTKTVVDLLALITISLS